jgi:hypothetical protein
MYALFYTIWSTLSLLTSISIVAIHTLSLNYRDSLNQLDVPVDFIFCKYLISFKTSHFLLTTIRLT